jgi:hypothetical protein
LDRGVEDLELGDFGFDEEDWDLGVDGLDFGIGGFDFDAGLGFGVEDLEVEDVGVEDLADFVDIDDFGDPTSVILSGLELLDAFTVDRELLGRFCDLESFVILDGESGSSRAEFEDEGSWIGGMDSLSSGVSPIGNFDLSIDGESAIGILQGSTEVSESLLSVSKDSKLDVCVESTLERDEGWAWTVEVSEEIFSDVFEDLVVGISGGSEVELNNWLVSDLEESVVARSCNLMAEDSCNSAVDVSDNSMVDLAEDFSSGHVLVDVSEGLSTFDITSQHGTVDSLEDSTASCTTPQDEMADTSED